MMVLSPDQIADRLSRALAEGGEAYALALAEVWSDGFAELTHEPALPQDGPADRAHMLGERRMLDAAFNALMPDFRNEDVLARVVGDVVYLFCTQSGTLESGVKIASPMCSRFTIKDGRVVKVVLAIDPVTVAPLQNAFEALAAAQKESMTS